jgi:hypothetical protein
VLLGDNFNEDTLRYILLMLDEFQAGKSFPDDSDLRSGMGSERVKEALSGE